MIPTVPTIEITLQQVVTHPVSSKVLYFSIFQRRVHKKKNKTKYILVQKCGCVMPLLFPLILCLKKLEKNK